MDRTRRRRHFNNKNDGSGERNERFRFPLDVEEETGSHMEDSYNFEQPGNEQEDSFIRGEQRKRLFEDTAKPEKQESSYTISKAREIPSAVHGTKKQPKPDEEETAVEKPHKDKQLPGAREVPSAVYGTSKQKYSDDEILKLESQVENYNSNDASDGYKSPIVEKLKEERIRRAEKEHKRLQAVKARKEREQARYKDPYSINTKPSHEKQQSVENIERKTVEEDSGSKQSAAPSISPFNVVMTPYDKKKEMTASRRATKRSGPKSSMPSIHMLEGDEESEQPISWPAAAEQQEMTAAFKAAGVPAEVVDYQTNGIIGIYEMALERNFRLNNIEKLKADLKRYLSFESIRIIAPITGTSNIGVEVPATSQNSISFSTVFSSSSLKMRKNDYKFVIGKTVDDKIFSYDLQKTGHILFYGDNEVDSAGAIDNILTSIMMNHNPKEFKMMIASGKHQYDDYQGLPHLFSEPKSIMDPDVLSNLLKELNDRDNQFRRAHVRNITSYNQRVNYESKKSVIAVIVDDLSTLFENNNPDAVRTIIQILRKGKPLGIHLIMKHTRPEVGIRSDLLQMMQTRISYKDENSKVIEGSDQLSRGNDMLIQIPTSNKPLRVNGAVLPDDSKQRVFSHLKQVGG
ncbi:DNA translocase FtsK [Salinicoccus albus]|uniref:DNA translocase FtsK n=1 Tax=Salinicoccus albus TaxID=418756 RepID=UPI0003734B78|nr:DNA translocase FtsK [Salinicoccus albus]